MWNPLANWGVYEAGWGGALGNLLYSFQESTLPGQIIVFVLLIGSVFAWTVMLSKGVELSRGRGLSQRFHRLYAESESPTSLYMEEADFRGTPLYRVYMRVCWSLEEWLEEQGGSLEEGKGRLSAGDMEALQRVTERAAADEGLRLEEGMSPLATAVSVSPFLGLLGTVWGVMEAFGGMANAGAATLRAVAPGISGALLTTVVGLLVALPSTVGYNFLTAIIRAQAVELENFVQELNTDLTRHWQADESSVPPQTDESPVTS